MIKPVEYIEPQAGLDLLVGRALALGLPVWMFTRSGRVDRAPRADGVAGAWLSADALTTLVEGVAGRAIAGDPTDVTELFPGVRAVPLPLRESGRLVRFAVALEIAPGVESSEMFRTICADADIDPEATAQALAALRPAVPLDLGLARRVLDWMHADLDRADGHQIAIRDFSRQLDNVYEQITLLFDVAGSMTSIHHPLDLVKRICGRLHNTLSFDWIAVRFSSLTALGRVLANDLILAGTIPCSYTRFDKLAGELSNRYGATRGADLLEPDQNELAELCGSELIVTPIMCDERVAAVILAGNKFGEDTEISSIDAQLIGATCDYLGAFLHNTTLYTEQRTTFLGIIRALSASIDAKDRYTRGHSERVAHLASQLALAVGLSEEQSDRVRLAGLLHDMGKIGVPEAVLLKPGKLSPSEFDQIKQHPTIGYNILKDIEPLEDVLPGVLHHHERWDGKGYPHGLKEEAIPMIARLVAVADTFDAMSSSRSYRAALLRKRVLREIRLQAGEQLDPVLAKRFVTLDLREYDRLVARHEANDARAA